MYCCYYLVRQKNTSVICLNCDISNYIYIFKNLKKNEKSKHLISLKSFANFSFLCYKGSWCALFKTEIHIPWEITEYPWGMHSLNLHVPPVTRYSSILLSFLVLNWQIICEIGAVLKWTEPRALTLNASKGIGDWRPQPCFWPKATQSPCMTYVPWDLRRRKWRTHDLVDACSQGQGQGRCRVHSKCVLLLLWSCWYTWWWPSKHLWKSTHGFYWY